MAALPRGSHLKVVVATVAALLCACAVVLVAVGSEGVVAEVEMLSEPMSALGRGEKQKSVRRAFSQLNGLDDTAAARLEELAPMNWLEKIYGRDNTYDFDALKNLKAGDVSEAGYDGMPQIKGAIPTPQAMTAADALLKNAIDSGTMPADVQNPWDGQPYVPSDEFKQKLTNAWAGFHQAVGEKRWEAKVIADCVGKTTAAGCPHAQSGTHEGYVTQWDGTQWNQFDGKEFKKLE